jgi:hypothetical protein
MHGVSPVQEIKPEAETLANDCGIAAVHALDYERLRGIERDDVLF